MHNLLKVLLIVSFILSSQAMAQAQKTPQTAAAAQQKGQVKPGPINADMIDVEADKMDVNKAKGITVFKGNVKATQGDVTIKGAVLTLYTDKTTNKVGKMVVEKNVYIKWEEKESTCDKAVYTVANRFMELTGNVVITRGQERVSGQKVTIDMVNDHQVVESGQSGRVKVRVNAGKETGVMEWNKK